MRLFSRNTSSVVIAFFVCLTIATTNAFQYSGKRTALNIRGGESINGSAAASRQPPKSRKKKKRRKRKISPLEKASKSEISQTLKDKDVAEAFGDAIRQRAAELRFGDTDSLAGSGVEASVNSLSWALGASDRRYQDITKLLDSEENPGVHPSASAVIANYFLKSHGGAHSLQSLFSLLASLAGIGAVLSSAYSSTANLSISLMKRCMLFGMVKHVSGLIAAAVLSARAIPDVGFRKVQAWMEDLVLEPISQYVFYTACVLLWLPQDTSGAASKEWWQEYSLMTFVFVAPVLLREIVSTLLVIHDVLVLWTLSTANSSGISAILLKSGQAASDALMSILVTPRVWRDSDSSTRQAVLARLASRISLAFEVLVGLVMLLDCLYSLVSYTFGSVETRAPFFSLIRRLICTRLFVHFIWARRGKIETLTNSIRGGASQFPLYVLQVLIEPRASMGLEGKHNNETFYEEASNQLWTWKDYVKIGFGI